MISILEIQDVLNRISETCSMKVYFYIWNLTWIAIWRIEITIKYCEWNFGDLLLPFFYLWKLPCAAMFLFAILEFCCIERFAYALPSLVFNIFLCLYMYPSVIVSHSFFSVLLSWNCYFAYFPLQFQGPVIVCAVFAYLLSLTLLVVSPCPEVVVMTLNFTNKPEISSFTIYILCLCCYHSKMKPSTSSYRWSFCPVTMGSSQIHCTSWTSHPPDIANV